MKKCPFCAEDIQDEAVKCKHCGSMLPKPKWYFGALTMVISFIVVGPLMLPLVWSNPELSRQKKIVITGVIIALTILIMIMFADAVRRIGGSFGTIM